MTQSKVAKITINLVFLAVALGQLIRFQIFHGANIGLTSVDVVTILLAIFFLINGIRLHLIQQWWHKIWRNKFWRWTFIFLFWATLSLAVNFFTLSKHDFLVAFSYLGRLYLLYGIAALIWADDLLLNRDDITRYFLIWSSVLLVIGFLQFIFVSNFGFMAKFGWDPHVGRMLSTFFDPNFFGAYLALVMAVIAAIFHKEKHKYWLGLFFILCWVGLFLTFSRSAWISGLIAVPLVLMWRNWKMSLAILFVFIIVIFVPSRLSSRFQYGTTLLNKNAAETSLNSSSQQIAQSGFDPSGAARILSFHKGAIILEHHWLFGVGYNAYGFALIKSGLADNALLTARSGYSPDSSLLEIVVTTGVIGLILYLNIFWIALRKLYQQWRNNTLPVASALFGFTIAWIAGSFLDNTLLYVFILLPWLILYSLTNEAVA